jgi:peptidoglycan/LPS O-acetylase OafA/YrhL
MDLVSPIEPSREETPAQNQATRSGTAWPYRYELLDGLRGAAALVVVMHHVGIVQAGHFAVMVFFVISGYCITASAESFRNRSQSIADFLRRRVRRIYPPYLVAVAFYATTRTVKALAGGTDQLSRSPLDWLQNLTLTQWLTLLRHPQPWPSENPTLFVGAFWSLNYEEQFYLVIALCLLLSLWKRIPILAVVAILAAAGLALNLARPANWICGLFLEYWVHFALGASLFFLLCKYTSRRARFLYVALLLAVGIALSVRLLPWSAERIADERAPMEIAFLVGVTLVLLALRPLSVPLVSSKWWKPFAALGAISYSLYLVHQFNVHLVNTIAGRILPRAPSWLNLTCVLALHVALASVFWYFFERPFLGRRTPAGYKPGPLSAFRRAWCKERARWSRLHAHDGNGTGDATERRT